MRFCHITTYYPPYHYGGDAIIVRSICEHLASLGHEVDVVYCRDSFELDSFEPVESRREVPGLQIHELRQPLGALSPLITHQTGRPGLKYRALKKILDRDYDVVHFHNISLVGGPGVLKMSQAPVTLYSIHEHWLFCPTHVLWKFKSRPCDKPQCFRCAIFSGKPPQFWRFTRLVADALSQVDCMLVPSQFTANKHREAGINAPICILPSFSTIQPTAAEPATAPERPVFVFAGRLEKPKGIAALLEALSKRPDFRLLVAGSGSMEDDMQRRFDSFENIHFLGLLPHDELKELLSGVTAAIVPCWGAEVFPLTVLEALSCGVPVIVRRSGGSAEAIESGGGGWIYDHEEELLPLLDRIAADPDQVNQKAKEALDNARCNFHIDSWMGSYFELITDIRSAKQSVAV
jgi:glycosyltransferase involved in cell wall biosynthesis